MRHGIKTPAALAAALLTAFTLAQHIDQKPLIGEAPHPARDSRLTVFREPDRSCYSKVKTELDIPVNTCASANFTLDGNVHVTYPGLCPGWTRAPYMAIYTSSDCTGEYSHPTWYDRGGGFGPGHCLGPAAWGKDVTPRENQWSIMFRCDNAETPEPRTITISLPALPPPKEKPTPQPRAPTASVSDSACWIPGLKGIEGAPRFLFKRVRADTCLDIAAKRRLKIYRNALCANGTEALFARFASRGCRGEPVVLKPVGQDMLATNTEETCIDMGGEQVSSYAFWCTGDVRQQSVEEELFPDGRDGVRLHYINAKTGLEVGGESAARSTWRTGAFGVAIGAVALVAGLLMS